MGQLDDRRDGADARRLRVCALRPRAAVRAGPNRGRLSTRVRRDGREPLSPGASQANGRPDARSGGGHSEAVHVHVHPSRRRVGVRPALCVASRAGPLARGTVPVCRNHRHGSRVAALGPARRQHRPPRGDPARGDTLHRHRDVQCDAGVPVEPRRMLLHGVERGWAPSDRLLAACGDELEFQLPGSATRRGGSAGRRHRNGTRLPACELDRPLADPALRLADHVVLRRSDGTPVDRAQPLHPRVGAVPVRERAGRGGAQRVPRLRDHRLRTSCRGRLAHAVRPRAGIRQRLPSPLPHDHPGPDPLRPRLGTRELRFPRLAPGVPGKDRRECRAGHDGPRQGGPLRDSGLGRRRLALRALEQSLDVDPRSCTRGGRPRGLRRLRRHDRAPLGGVHGPAGRAARRHVGNRIGTRAVRRRDLPDRDPRSRLGSCCRRDEARRRDRSRDRGRLLGASRCCRRGSARGRPGRARRRLARVRRDRDARQAARGDLGGRATRDPAARGRAARDRTRSLPAQEAEAVDPDPRRRVPRRLPLVEGPPTPPLGHLRGAAHPRPGRVPLPALVSPDRNRDSHVCGDRVRRHVLAEARRPLAGQRASDRQRDRVHHARPGNAARRLVDVSRRLGVRGGGCRRDGVEVPHPLPGQARLQPVERRPCARVPDPW